MHLTPELLSAAYDFLRHTKPFDGWNLPEPEDVQFAVLKRKTGYGDAGMTPKGWVIRLSDPLHERTTGLLSTMAHEMIHVHLDESACTSRHKTLRTDSRTHGPAFRAFAKQVLEHHLDFDPVTF